MKFGDILRRLREDKNISQVQLARSLNITSQSLSQYELGKRMPDIEMISKLADFFDVSVDYLLGRDAKNIPYIEVKDDGVRYNANKNIEKEIHNLSEESQEDLKRYLELLKIKDMQKRNSEASDELTSIE